VTAANALHSSDAAGQSSELDDAVLRKVVAAWSKLPQHVRQTIVMLVESQ
jgi:hypothetical protein